MKWYDEEGRISGKMQRKLKRKVIDFAIKTWPDASLYHIKWLLEQTANDLNELLLKQKELIKWDLEEEQEKRENQIKGEVLSKLIRKVREKEEAIEKVREIE